jgi:protease-4
MRRRAVPSILILACALAPFGAAVASAPSSWDGADFGSAAFADGALALRFNPAALGTRYPSELRLAGTRFDQGPARLEAMLALGTMGFGFERTGERSNAFGAGLGTGGERLRLGFASSWLRDRSARAGTSDSRIGVLARPAPWLSLGGVADHLFQPSFLGGPLGRTYTVAVGLRPLALSAGRAHDLGTRLTLTGDLSMPESGDRRRSRARVGAELEAVRGIVLQGALADHGVMHVGLVLRGPRTSIGGGGSSVDGEVVARNVALSLHDGEERTVLAGPAAARVALVRAGGELGDDALSGLTLFGGSSVSPVKPLHDQLELALEDPLTRGVLLDLHGVHNMAQIEELRPRILGLRRAGKPVVAFLEEGATRGDLYFAGPCDRIVTTEEAQFGALGLRVERRSYRRLLAEWGIRIDRTAYGKYKSAYRNYSADSTPAPDRESINRVLDTNQELFVSALTTDRRINRAALLTALDGRPWRAEDARRMGLVDSIGYREDALRILGRMCGLGDTPRTANLGRVTPARSTWMTPSPIAVVYASGAIQSGKSGNDLLLGPAMGAATVVGQLERAFRRPGVKVVLLRVESPGGETIASDLIHHATVRLKRDTKKPLIVSMGESGASGGYYIAAHGDRIYADRFTYTGSIGVVQIKPSIEGWDRAHDVRQEDFDRGRFMRGWSIHRDWTPEMQAIADSATFRYYASFVAKVADGRRMSWSAVDSVAQGRVWMGDDALARGLVDEIGGFEAALAYARRRAGVPEGARIRLVEYRRPRPGLVQRLVGSSLLEAIEASSRIPDPGAMLYWDDGEAAP